MRRTSALVLRNWEKDYHTAILWIVGKFLDIYASLDKLIRSDFSWKHRETFHFRNTSKLNCVNLLKYQLIFGNIFLKHSIHSKTTLLHFSWRQRSSKCRQCFSVPRILPEFTFKVTAFKLLSFIAVYFHKKNL